MILEGYSFTQKSKHFGCDGKLGIPASVQRQLAYARTRGYGLHAHGVIPALDEFL
jgi:hypothetical protein